MDNIYTYIGNALKNTYVDILLYLFVPLFLIVWLWKRKNSSKLSFLIKVFCIGSFLVAIFWAPYREITVGYYTNYILLALFLSASVLSFLKARKLPVFTKMQTVGIVGSCIGIILTLCFSYINIDAFTALSYSEEPVDFMFPLKNGSYAVIQGGNGASSYLVNYHYNAWKLGTPEDTLSKYSTDIIKINRLGFCYKSFDFLFNSDLPKDLSKYEMFGETLYSPCDGEVWNVDDGNADVLPTKDEGYTIGNSVTIKFNDNYYVALHHLEEGTITVGEGDMVKRGQPIAKIGNSGNTNMPHLHIQAWKIEGVNYIGVPIVFGNSFPVKNKIYYMD